MRDLVPGKSFLSSRSLVRSSLAMAGTTIEYAEFSCIAYAQNYADLSKLLTISHLAPCLTEFSSYK